MKTEFMVAVSQLSAEKNLPREVVLSALELALASAYKKDAAAPGQNISVKINPNTGEVKVYVQKTVVEEVTDPYCEISLAEVQKTDDGVRPGDVTNMEFTPPNAGRIAAQTARQVILQRLHEAEHNVVFKEFSGKEGDVLTGVVQRIAPEQIYIDLGKAEAVIPASEQVRKERYRVGQRLKLYLLEVARTSRGPQIVVSRSHRNLLRRLIELEIPEVHNGTIEIKSVAREAGYRSKVSVAAHQKGIDPVGCCVGLRGIRVQNIVTELDGEKIDVVEWSDDPRVFIANALSPAQVLRVELSGNGDEDMAVVIVPDKQLSLAIGKEGQNARLAAKLTGWRIDIKSSSTAEAEKATLEVEANVELDEQIAKAIETEEVLSEVTVSDELQIPEPVDEGQTEEITKDAIDYEFVLASEIVSPGLPVDEPHIRFAEDILPSRSGKAEKDKKSVKDEAGAQQGEIKVKKKRPKKARYIEEDEFESEI